MPFFLCFTFRLQYNNYGFMIFRITLIFSLFLIYSCNSGKSDEEMDELWSKAQTRSEIINRSGTLFNSGVDMDLAMRDAETRLQSGGGLLGKGGLSIEGILGNKSNCLTAALTPENSLLPVPWSKLTRSIHISNIRIDSSVA